MDPKNIKVLPSSIEGIDFNKLKIVIRNNWYWLALIFVLVNSGTFLIIRYTKEIYGSESVIKLDLKKEASGFGIKGLTGESPNSNLISGEIEIIQSRLFLGQLLDSLDLNVSFYSIGRVLNYDLYNNPPAYIDYTIKNDNAYNTPIYFDHIDDTYFTLRLNGNDKKIKCRYNQKISLRDVDLLIIRNKAFFEGGEIGYFFTINSRDALLNYLLANLIVEPLNYNANTIRIAFHDNNPYKARTILSNIDNLYLSYSNEQKNLTNKQKIDWVIKELNQIEKKMESFENYFENFTLENKTSDADEELKRTITILNNIDSQRFELTRKLNVSNQLIDNLHSDNLSFLLSSRILLPEYLNRNLDELQQLNTEQEKLKLSYNETTFAFREKEKSIENLKNKTANLIAELRKEYLRKLHDLNLRKTKLEKEFISMPDKKTQFSKNQRFYKLYEEFYLTLMKSKSEFEIAQAGSTPDFKILTPATTPTNPLSPSKFIIAGIGLTSSIFLIVFFIGILYLLNNKITNINELEKFVGVPLLGIIPSSQNLRSNALHVLDHPKSMVSEAIRTLRTNLDFFSVGSAQKVIAISSTVSGEGKSFIAMNLGGAMALSKKKVILLDLDMRKPKTNLPVQIDDRSKGMSTILIRKDNWKECITRTAVDNFDYIPSGPHPPNPSELLLNGEFSNLIEDLKKDYDFIILDTPPVGLVTDGIMAMKRADISIYIFRANYSKKDFLGNLNRIININKFSNIMMLLNALPSSTKKGFGYGYYEETNKSNWFLTMFKKV